MSHVLITKNTFIHLNKSRKRQLDPEKWKNNANKAKRNRGEDYVSRNGVPVPAKQFVSAVGKVCIGRCRFEGCNTDDDTKKSIHESYWSLGSFHLQRTHLMGMFELVPRAHTTQKRYFILVNGDRKEVCRSTFCQVYGISKDIIKNVATKMGEGKLAIMDGRGIHLNRPGRTPNNVKNLMLAHINRYPQYDIHYSRRKEGEKYLSSELNVMRMFRQFVEAHPEVPNVDKKKNLFHSVFRQTGLVIAQPKSDTCKQCDELFVILRHATNDLDRESAKRALESHQIQADAGYASMYEDIAKSKNDQKYVTLCCDLQQVLFTPTLTHGDMFYLRQYSTYNFCVYNGADDQGYMHVWHENEGNRGVDEIGSAILFHLTSKYDSLAQGEERTLVIWSDRCRGQNNNYQIICLLLLLIKKKYFTKITQKFLSTGHSFLPCDRMFATIEKRKKVCMAYVPEDWIEIIKSSRPANPFHVTCLSQERIMKIKDYLDLCFPRPITLKVSEIHVVEISSECPSIVLTRPDHNPGVWTCHQITAPNQHGIRHASRLPLNLSLLDIQLERKYHELLPISNAKKNDLRQMMNFLSPEHASFYENIIGN